MKSTSQRSCRPVKSLILILKVCRSLRRVRHTKTLIITCRSHPLDSNVFADHDENSAVEWTEGTTTNPLVTSFNTTMRSDARIFSSDGNRTMKALAKSPALFRSQCTSLFGRMIDTVPSTVKLSAPITPYPVKPVGLRLTVLNQTSIHMGGYIRVREHHLRVDRIRVLISFQLFDQSAATFGPHNISASYVTVNISSSYIITHAWWL